MGQAGGQFCNTIKIVSGISLLNMYPTNPFVHVKCHKSNLTHCPELPTVTGGPPVPLDIPCSIILGALKRLCDGWISLKLD